MNKQISKQWKWAITLLVLLIAISLVQIGGLFLDKQAEQVVQNLYHRDPNGVIDGLQSQSVLQGKKRAVILVHGFLDTPALFSELVNDIKDKVDSDIYVPLLPFHGRDLTAAAQFNNQIILDKLEATIHTLAKKYDFLTVVGMSYGRALLTKLVNENKILQKVNLILYAPAFYIQTNTEFGPLKPLFIACGENIVIMNYSAAFRLKTPGKNNHYNML